MILAHTGLPPVFSLLLSVTDFSLECAAIYLRSYKLHVLLYDNSRMANSNLSSGVGPLGSILIPGLVELVPPISSVVKIFMGVLLNSLTVHNHLLNNSFLPRSLVKNCPEFIRTSMSTSFNNTAEDLGRTIQNLHDVSYN